MTFANVVKDLVGYLATCFLMKFRLMLTALTGISSQQKLFASYLTPGFKLGSESLSVVGAMALAAASGV